MFSNHINFGIDFDKTLIQHSNSHILQKYIAENYKTKNFYIITFRSGGLEDFIEDDLNDETKGLLNLSMFKGIYGIPDELYEGAKRIECFYKNKPPIQWHKIYKEYRLWKGNMCKKLNCSVMIDDNAIDVEYGCEYYDIQFIDILNVNNNKYQCP